MASNKDKKRKRISYSAERKTVISDAIESFGFIVSLVSGFIVLASDSGILLVSETSKLGIFYYECNI